MKKMNENQLQNLEGGKFWGWSCGPQFTLGGQCYRTCTYRILGFKNVEGQYGCDDLPGSNPTLN
jgi:hypothetical protein